MLGQSNFSIDSADTQTTSIDNSNEFSGPSRKRVKIRRPNKENHLRQVPSKWKTIFPFTFFSKFQSDSFDSLYNSSNNCVIKAPMGTERRVLFELAMLRILDSGHDLHLKILCLTSTKLVGLELTKIWRTKFKNWKTLFLNDESPVNDFEQVETATIIISTPEKWDLLTRRTFLKTPTAIKLVLVEEINSMKDIRGAILEANITRLMRLFPNLRIILATEGVSNPNDLIEWLNCNKVKLNKESELLSTLEENGLTKRKRLVVCFKFNNDNDYQLDSLYNAKLPKIIESYGKNRSTLIFCPTRSSTVQTVKYLIQSFNLPHNNSIFSDMIDDPELRQFVVKSIAFHHAGLTMNDRNVVERKFLDGSINILCSTSTLSTGMNLRASLVIIKGTKLWINGELSEYPTSDILQLSSRVGVNGDENENYSIVMTTEKMKNTYKSLFNGSEKIDSFLYLQLFENILTEISLKTIATLSQTIDWFKFTFLNHRLRNSKIQYYLREIGVSQLISLEYTNIPEVCRTMIKEMENLGLITINRGEFLISNSGIIFSRHCISYQSMKCFLKLTVGTSLYELISMISNAGEFKKFKVRANEKSILKKINMLPEIRYNLTIPNGTSQIIDASWQKVMILLQYDLGINSSSKTNGVKLTTSLNHDKVLIVRQFSKLLKCAIDFFDMKRDGLSLKIALFLLRSITGKCWENSPLVLTQLKTLTSSMILKLTENGITTIKDLKTLSRDKIEYYLGARIGGAANVLNEVELIPEPILKINSIKRVELDKGSRYKIAFAISVKTISDNCCETPLSLEYLSLKKDGTLLGFKIIQLRKLKEPEIIDVEFQLLNDSDFVEIHLNITEIAGINLKMVLDEKLLEDLSSNPSINSSNAIEKDHIILDSSSDEEILALVKEHNVEGSGEALKLEFPQYSNNKAKIKNSIGPRCINYPIKAANIESRNKGTGEDRSSNSIESIVVNIEKVKASTIHDRIKLLNNFRYRNEQPADNLIFKSDKSSTTSSSNCGEEAELCQDLHELSRNIINELEFLGSDIEIE